MTKDTQAETTEIKRGEYVWYFTCMDLAFVVLNVKIPGKDIDAISSEER